MIESRLYCLFLGFVDLLPISFDAIVFDDLYDSFDDFAFILFLSHLVAYLDYFIAWILPASAAGRLLFMDYVLLQFVM